MAILTKCSDEESSEQAVSEMKTVLPLERIIEKPVDKPAPAKAQPENDEDPW